jgi:hypothetical protein
MMDDYSDYSGSAVDTEDLCIESTPPDVVLDRLHRKARVSALIRSNCNSYDALYIIKGAMERFAATPMREYLDFHFVHLSADVCEVFPGPSELPATSNLESVVVPGILFRFLRAVEILNVFARALDHSEHAFARSFMDACSQQSGSLDTILPGEKFGNTRELLRAITRDLRAKLCIPSLYLGIWHKIIDAIDGASPPVVAWHKFQTTKRTILVLVNALHALGQCYADLLPLIH